MIDLEVTSNRGDCLGHIGVAREIAVLYGQASSKVPEPNACDVLGTLQSTRCSPCRESVHQNACPRYTARVIQRSQGWPRVPIGLSKQASVETSIGDFHKVVNNVVDATNYVMMECGQPLHAFRLCKDR